MLTHCVHLLPGCCVQAASALIPTNQQPPVGLQQLIELSCAFGNSLTLPLLFCSTMLTGDAPLRATAYISLFHAAWSPLLWVWGYGRLMAAASSSSSSASSSRLGQQAPGAAAGRQSTGGAGGVLSWATDFAARLAALWPQPSGAKNPSSSTPTSPISKFGQTSEVLVARQLSPAAAAAAGGSGAAGRPVFAVSPTPAGDPVDAEDQGSPAEVLFKRLLKLGRGLLQLVLGPGVVARLKQALSPPVVAVVAGEPQDCLRSVL
jgi:predicted permease